MDSQLKSKFQPPRLRSKTLDLKEIINRPCYARKKKPEIYDKNLYKVIECDPQGPKIVVHLQKKLKQEHTLVKKKRDLYTYFIDHKNCSETEFYTKDLLHPKILRHHSKDKKKKVKPPTKEMVYSRVLSNSSRIYNYFEVEKKRINKGI